MARKRLLIRYICPLCGDEFDLVVCSCKRKQMLGKMAEYHADFCEVRREGLREEQTGPVSQ